MVTLAVGQLREYAVLQRLLLPDETLTLGTQAEAVCYVCIGRGNVQLPRVDCIDDDVRPRRTIDHVTRLAHGRWRWRGHGLLGY
jgi:hypothetical protein